MSAIEEALSALWLAKERLRESEELRRRDAEELLRVRDLLERAEHALMELSEETKK